MKNLTVLSLAIILFSCDPKDTSTPEPSINPPEWLIGKWTYNDSTNYSENLIVSKDDIVHERLLNSETTRTSYIDSCKTHNITVDETIKYNTYYHMEFTNIDNEVSHIYLAKIAANEIRLINGIRPTPKSFILND